MQNTAQSLLCACDQTLCPPPSVEAHLVRHGSWAEVTPVAELEGQSFVAGEALDVGPESRAQGAGLLLHQHRIGATPFLRIFGAAAEFVGVFEQTGCDAAD